MLAEKRGMRGPGQGLPMRLARAPLFPGARQHLREPRCHSRQEDCRLHEFIPTFSKFPFVSIGERKRKLSEWTLMRLRSRGTLNQRVVGSSPTAPTSHFKDLVIKMTGREKPGSPWGHSGVTASEVPAFIILGVRANVRLRGPEASQATCRGSDSLHPLQYFQWITSQILTR